MIFVVEIAVLVGGVPIAFHQMAEQLLVRVHVAVEVHGHEAGELKETGIDRDA